jgi:hypothetical protein
MCARFIYLSPSNQDTYEFLWVNATTIVCIAPIGGYQTRVSLVNGEVFTVKESPADILELLEKEL